MTDVRRYDDGEIAEILERAAEAEGRPGGGAGAADGLTLAQLQEIGAEVGIPPARIAEAARSVADRDLAGPTRTLLGAPRSVGRVVRIPRALDDDEWARLVADLRGTFRARGRVHVEGPFRSWSNGNLQVHVEPDGQGYRVRMGSVKGDATTNATIGATFLLSGGAILAAGLLGDPGASEAASGLLFGGVGAGLLAYTRAMLPAWARERRQQMERLAERIPRLLE